MVLGEYARHEFLSVDTAIKKAQYSEGQIASPKSTSIVVSASDKTMTVWEDDKIVATGKVKIKYAHKPLSEHVHMLTGHNKEDQSLHWSSTGYGKSDRDDIAAQLRRIEAEPGVREEARKRLHHGATVVTTNGSSTPAHRTSRDFVIIDSIY